MRLAWLALLLIPTQALAEDACEARAKKLAAHLARIPQHAQLLPPKLRVRLPKAPSRGQVARVGLTLDVARGRYHFQRAEAPVESLDPLVQELEGVRKAEKLTKARPAPAYLRLDRDQPLQPALPLLCRIASERETHLLVDDANQGEYAGYMPPPPPKQLEEVLHQVEMLPGAVEKATAMGNLLQQAIGKCTALTDRFSKLSEVMPADRPAKMVELVPEGLRACKCVDVDVDALEALVVRILAPTQPPSFARRFNLVCGAGDVAEIRLPKDATAQALAEALVRAKPRGPWRVVLAD